MVPHIVLVVSIALGFTENTFASPFCRQFIADVITSGRPAKGTGPDFLAAPLEVRRDILERLSYSQKRDLLKLLDKRQIDSLLGLDVEALDNDVDQELGIPVQAGGKRRSHWGSELRRLKEEKFGDEEIWYSPGGGQQSSYADIVSSLEEMNLKPGQSVVDLGSGIGRIGFVIGLLYPDVKFLGIEIVAARVLHANKVATEMGFQNVRYTVANMGDSEFKLPEADYYYAFNPTNENTSNMLASQLHQISMNREIGVLLLTGLDSQSFYKHFVRDSNGIYRNRNIQKPK